MEVYTIIELQESISAILMDIEKSRLYEAIDLNSTESIRVAKNAILEAIALHEPRVTVVEIRVTSEGRKLGLDIEWKPVGDFLFEELSFLTYDGSTGYDGTFEYS
ncbi:MAG: hypothetical protein F6K14_00435 [Symploca sp. SIO2C1]|nr:hypothetical protein [Symploca sp. SIO2C1]